MNPSNSPSFSQLCEMLLDARARTLALTSDLDATQLLGPRLEIVNPPLWEIGHVAWFQEHWCLRYRGEGDLLPSVLPDADRLYNSSRVPHDIRWDLPLPDRERTLSYMQRVLELVLEKLGREAADESLRYFAQLSLFHEDMHDEAFTYTRQTLGYAPAGVGKQYPAGCDAGPYPGDVLIAGGKFMLGSAPGSGFVFDNEKWEHAVELKPFSIARAAVTNEEYAVFVNEGGYQRRKFWSEAGWAWREKTGAGTPVYWLRHESGWRQRSFNRIAELSPHAPVMHVNWYEAEAYSRWAGRRLPTEAEWEMAAACNPADCAARRRYPWGNEEPSPVHANMDGMLPGPADVAAFAAGDSAFGCRQMMGNVWEWTATGFSPYPGFVADPYRDYSQPWFGDHMVLRGGSFATRARLLRNSWRNFFKPHRRDIFAGFRTCALT